MRILGIETSCDETSAAVVEETGDAAKPWATRSNVIASQIPIHREWGGVVPELASRQHIRDICGVVARALDEAQTAWGDLGAVAVTQGPGLVGSLLVGVSFAKAAAAAANLSLVGVHHLAGHIESLVLQNGELPLPSVVLVVSGGHTSLYLVERPGSYQLLSRTRDDAAGEAYDKVAKLLGLGYPGGPAIDRLAQEGDPKAIRFPRATLKRGRFDFSFSGFKTALREYLRDHPAAAEALPDVAASLPEALVDMLVDTTADALAATGVERLVVAGGVAANRRLRARMSEAAAALGVEAVFPRPA